MAPLNLCGDCNNDDEMWFGGQKVEFNHTIYYRLRTILGQKMGKKMSVFAL